MEDSGQSYVPAALLTDKQPPASIVYECDWAPESVCRESKPDSSVVHPVTESLYRLSYSGFATKKTYLEMGCMHF
jgi:hypothetical protein